MIYIYSIMFGIIQGLAEFLPISSSGHLIILHKFTNAEILNTLTFDVILHAGTLLALILFFKKDIFDLYKNKKLSIMLGLSTLPAIFIGFFLNNFIENYTRSILLVAFNLFFGAILLVIFEKKSRKQEIKNLSYKKSLLIGFAQAIALFPGISRSGITLTAGMGFGMSKVEAARFSFLMAIPIIFAATIYKISLLFAENSSQTVPIFPSALGFLVSFLFGYTTIVYFLKFLEKYPLRNFAIYRVLLSVFLMVIWFAL